MKATKNKLDVNVKLMLFSLITIVFVTIRILMDICSFIPSIGNTWSSAVWVISATILFVTNIISIVFTSLEYYHSKNQHRVLLIFVIIILSFTLALQTIWLILDIMQCAGSHSWTYNLIQDLKMITIIAIACDLVAIPIDIISTYFISAKIK